jgi:protein-disulfide isomerase
MEPQTQSSSAVAIPIAIVLGFALIALAIYFSGIGQGGGSAEKVTAGGENLPTTTSKIKPVDDSDYIKGNPNAPILIVEYSDYDCPFCKNFHETMNRVMNEYGVTGKVAWVYRQFPIPQLHPNAARISEAALCVGELGGNDAFWKFSDLVFGERNLNEPTNITKLPSYAEQAGVTENDFVACIDSGRHEAKVTESVQDGAKAGINGTPHSFIVVGNQQVDIKGAQPYEVVKGMVEKLIEQLEGTTPQ